ncbi:esterase [Agromyces rhizosphaerae]|uniref:Esterase n=1 Tax=Agromyces rhizosphaerae TaxID=88374 RepID=A0A9W6CYC7_9MICO|nr:dienelactone hydrolase family protein [Agromyces rhizosphaerae]GLI27920.1 esterase [Agromyces rhizosphaerae]
MERAPRRARREGTDIDARDHVTIDQGSVLWSASGADREGRPLLALLHGYNSHEGDLFGLSPYLPLQPVIASLRAPLHTGYGFAWFPLQVDADGGVGLGEAEARRAEAAADAVIAWAESLDPAPPAIGLLGFSQGGALAIELLRRRSDLFGFAVSLAGFVLPGERAGDAELADRRPPVFWGRGTEDVVIPADAVARTQEWLPERVALDARIYEGVGHSVSEQELADVTGFLRERYA